MTKSNDAQTEFEAALASVVAAQAQDDAAAVEYGKATAVTLSSAMEAVESVNESLQAVALNLEKLLDGHRNEDGEIIADANVNSIIHARDMMNNWIRDSGYIVVQSKQRLGLKVPGDMIAAMVMTAADHVALAP
jgi:hypothetical protein